MSEIRTSGPLLFTEPNNPTRVGEIINTLNEIYDIPMPRLGMSVYVKDEGVNYTITKLEPKLIEGVLVPDAKVAEYELQTGKSIAWNSSSNVNDYVVAGVYNITGERLNVNDGLPIANSNPGHTISARLVVLDSSITGTGDSQDKCITQVLTLSNRTGEDGNMYIRTGHGGNINSLSWEPWATLQTNTNVDQVDNLDNLKDNGIYSGVWTKGYYAAYPLTFVCIVINDYFVGITPRRISQFVYGLSKMDGSVVYQSRVWDDSKNAWGDWEILNQKEISSMISSEIAKLVDKAPENLDTLKEFADWIENHGNEVVAITDSINSLANTVAEEIIRAENAEKDIRSNAMQYNTLGVNVYADKAEIYGRSIDTKVRTYAIPSATTEKAGVMSAEDKKTLDNMPSTIEDAITEESKAIDKKIASEKTDLVNGDTIVGQAREIHSRNGKTVTDSFLARTTAGSGTIGDGVASLKSVGGNIVKNLVDGTSRDFFTINGNIYDTIKSDNIIISHIHYATVVVYNYNADSVQISVGGGWINNSTTKELNKCVRIASYGTGDSRTPYIELRVNSSDKTIRHIYIYQYLAIDLTEMFGAGNEPDQATCDRLFGTMDALPQGLTIAKPTEFNSIGFNQFNPDNVLEGKAIVDNAIVSGDKKIAVIPCLPCKVSVGENNGYCIHGEFGEDIKVYLTPLNPMEVDGALYMHELTKDATTDTYVPQIKGYMLVEVPTTANLCAYFLWSEDKCERDSYEPYFDSKIELPVIPQMSEWGLAGIQSSGTLTCDEIYLERGVYVKRIDAVDLGSVVWNRINSVWRVYRSADKVIYTPEATRLFFTAADYYPDKEVANVRYDSNSDIATITADGNGYIAGEVFARGDNIEIAKWRCERLAMPAGGDNIMSNIVSHKYPTITRGQTYYGCASGIGISPSGYISIIDSAFDDMKPADVATALSGVMAYYELATPEEYPLPKVDNNYISSDYGVEQFDSNVPCNANNLYYMRSLAGETRNFLDRLMAGLGTSDATVVADRILAVVNPVVEPANVEPETPIEE